MLDFTLFFDLFCFLRNSSCSSILVSQFAVPPSLYSLELNIDLPVTIVNQELEIAIVLRERTKSKVGTEKRLQYY